MSDFLTDVFNSDAFSLVTLTGAVNRMPYVPGMAGKLGIFKESGVPTTSVSFEFIDGIVQLIPNTPYGAPANKITSNRRKDVLIKIPHFPTEATVWASEIQNVRSFGNASQLETIEEVRDRKLANHMGSLDATVEYGRIGALKGQVLDYDGTTVLLDIFALTGDTQDNNNVTLSSTSTEVKTAVDQLLRRMDTALGSSSYSSVQVLCGDTFFDEFTTHVSVTKYYQNWMAAQQYQGDLRSGFPFGGCLWSNYRGTIGGIKFIADTEAYAFPVGVPGLFQTNFAPAPYMETVNTIGLPRYAKPELLEFGKGIKIELQTNAISYCMRPKVLQKLVAN